MRGRGRPAPMARAVGAGTRLPRRERAHAAGFLPTGTRSMARRGQLRGRGRPAPMARAVGAGTRLPRRERAHAAGLLPTGTRSMARRGQPQGAGRRVSCAFQALATLASPAFAAKTAHAIASVGRVWDPPASERRPSPYRAQRGRPLTAAARAKQHISERRPSPYRAQRGRPLTAAARAKQLFSAKTVDKAKRWCYHSCKQRRRRQSRYESSTHGPQLRLLLYL